MVELSKAGLEFGRGKKPDKGKMKQVLSSLSMKSGVPIKKVRLLVPEKTIQPIRKGRTDEAYVKPDSTHHLCFFEWEENGKTKWDFDPVTQLQAINRLKRQQQELAKLIEEWQNERLSSRQIDRRKRREMQRIAKDAEKNNWAELQINSH